MCGICAGLHTTTEYVAERIKDLQYRGGDSWGLSTFVEDGPHIYKRLGREIDLVDIRKNFDYYGQILGHCRWSSSSKVSIENCHPILSYDEKIALIHNGSLENYKEIDENLRIKYDIHSVGGTDTEVATNWIAQNPWNIDVPEEFDRMALKFQETFTGTWSIVFAVKDLPHKLFFLVKDSPLYYHEGFLCSDGEILPAFFKIPNNSCGFIQFWPNNDRYYLYLNGTYITPQYSFIDIDTNFKSYSVARVQKLPEVEKMLNEIHEQAYLNYDFDRWGKEFLSMWSNGSYNKVDLIGCGSSFSSALLGKFYFNSVGINCDVNYPSEYNIYNHNNKNSLKIAISQSGETLDIQDCLQKLPDKENSILLTNKQTSSCSDYTSRTINLAIGPEKGVAATKSFSATALTLLAFAKYSSGNFEQNILEEFRKLVLEVLNQSSYIEKIAQKISKFQNVVVLGSQLYFPIAVESSLKLKEVSGIFAESMYFESFKHGPIALCGENTLSICLLPAYDNPKYSRLIGNIEQIKARNGKTLIIAENNLENELFIKIPKSNEKIAPLITMISLQLLSYYVGKNKGICVDSPPNCAKAITVF